MDKYIGFEIDSKKTVVCEVQQAEKDRYITFKNRYWTNEKLSSTTTPTRGETESDF